MMKLYLRHSTLFLAAAISVMALTLPAYAQLVWQGSWKTNFGKLHLVQKGNRVYGDYDTLGILEGQLSANSTVYRGTFQRDDGKWGTFHFQRQAKGFRFKGHWRFGGITKRGDASWSGERITGRRPPLKKAIKQTRFWATAVAPVPTGSYKAFFENKRRKLVLPKIPGVSSPISKPQKSNPANRPIQPKQKSPMPGSWHHGWILDSQTDAYELRLDVDHFKGSDVAQVEMSFFTLKHTDACPRVMHPQLCEEMQARLKTNDVRDFAITIEGVTATTNTLKVAWRFKRGKYPYLLVIKKDLGAPTGYRAQLFHYKRGLEHFAFARKQPHICKSVPCASDRLTNLRRYPDQFRGKFNDVGYEARFPKSKNTITAAHDQRDRRAAQNSTRPEREDFKPQENMLPNKPVRPATRMQSETLVGHWYLRGENGETLGSLTFDQAGATAKGMIEEQMLSGTSRPTSASILKSSSEAAIYKLLYTGTDDYSAHLLITLPTKTQPSGEQQLQGTLIQGQFWKLVTLVQKPGSTLSVPNEMEVDEADFNDLPGSGVTGPAYRLRSVPSGKSIKLRTGPDRTYSAAVSLASEATDFFVLSCVPEINPVVFDQADLEGKYTLLSRSWCEVSHEQAKGYLPGIYLDPILNR